MLKTIRLRQLVFATLLCASFYILAQCATVYFYVSAFEDFVRDQVKFAPFRHGVDENNLFVNIVDAARYYNLEVDPQQIKIRKTTRIPGMSWTTLGVDVTYTASLDLSLFKRPLHFHTSATVAY